MKTLVPSSLACLLALGAAPLAAQQSRPAPGRGVTGSTTFTPSRPIGPRDSMGPVGVGAARPPVVVRFRPLPQCRVFPDSGFWGRRDILAEIVWMSRHGFIPVVPVPADATELIDHTQIGPGWKGYAFVVPAKGKLHVRLHHPNEAWFRLLMVDKWGKMRAGMLQNLIPTGNPEVSYENPTDETQAVYVIVDDPGWMSSEQNPYTLKIERSWDPAQVKPGAKPVQGIWTAKKVDVEKAGFEGAP